MPGGRATAAAQKLAPLASRPLGVPLRHPYPRVRAVAFSADGKKVATACVDHPERGKASVACTVGIWDAVTGRLLAPWIPQRNWVVALAFSPDGKLLATGDYSSGVHLWDAATGER